MPAAAVPRNAVRPASLMHRLLHRWFVQYNPLYLVSAALVLAGVLLLSAGLSREAGIVADLALAAVTELYQLLLIGGAALLMRRGLFRPAVMVALIQVVYLCDLTVQTDAAAYMGSVGLAFAAGWFALTVVKLHALCWALRLRLGRGARALFAAGALALCALPQLVASRLLDEQLMAALLGAAVLLLGLAAQHPNLAPRWRGQLSPWGQTVLRRAARASWLIWGSLLLAHLVWCCLDCGLSPGPVLVAAWLVLVAGRVRRERGAWAAVSLVLGLVLGWAPWMLSAAGLLVALTLLQLAWRGLPLSQPQSLAAGPLPHPYRVGAGPDDPPPRQQGVRYARGPHSWRFVGGALCASYLALCSAGWQGGALPAHQPLGALLLTLGLGVLAWRGRQLLPLAAVVALWGDLALQRGLVSPPRGLVQWGALALVLGFVLLPGAVWLNLWHRQRQARYAADNGGEP